MTIRNCPDVSELTSFLYHEADLLDQTNLREWIDLYSEEGTYWMPVTVDQADPLNHISIFYDDKAMMKIRMHNLGHARAPSKENPVRSSHIIGNVRLVDFDKKTGNCVVKSNFQAVVYQTSQTLFAGSCTHDLVWAGDKYLIRQKRVDLINCDASHSTIINYI
ncbi:aromatic-ring-hydroxylating dioxygenase subunit beta [Paremcibacter congregatus]|nr:aromatic-ring-hydroxylating dioxygenase subunit beta [Paremcibacter congregatus]|tara:strand:- start:10130 stop:10618 length:489 start_codon:yes stop_codon:yes gene_type:complete